MARHGPSGPAQANRAMLMRHRLVDRLRARWFTPLIAVTAPAGYGKTTLLVQAVEANDRAPLGVDRWVTCGPGDGDVDGFGRALCSAVEAPPPADGNGRGDGDGDGDDGDGDGDGQLDAYARAVVEGLWRWSPRQVAVLIDDAHEIPADSAASRLLTRLIDRLPANGHVVVAGRPPAPVPLARLAVAGRVLRLGQDELAFTGAEQAQFARLRGVPGPRLARSAGWPALAELDASASTELVPDYVGHEVLGPIAPAHRRGLAVLAHVGTVDRELVAAVLGPGGDAERLVAGLPLVTVLPTGEWSLHALWRSLLAAPLGPEELDEVRREAATLLRGRGRLPAAVRLFLAAGAWDDVTATVVDALGAAHPPLARDTLDGWLARLPPEHRDSPAGRLLRAATAAQSDPDGAWRGLQEAAAAFRRRHDDAGELACLVQLGQIAWWTEDVGRLAGLVDRVFQLEAAGCRPAAALACVARALVADLGNDSRAVLAELDRLAPGALNEVWLGVVGWFRSISHMHLGEAGAALDWADRARELTGPLHRLLAEGARLQALWYLGQVEAVRDALPGLVDRMARAGHRNYTALAAAHCCEVLAQGGDGAGAAVHLARARAAAATPDTPLVATNLALAEAWLAVAAGDEAGATTVLRAHLERQPLGAGHSAAPYQRSLVPIYVLVPETRPVWDDADLGPAFRPARQLASWLVAVREHGALPADATPLPDAATLLPHVPLRWSAALALAALNDGRADGWRLLEQLGPAARAAVATAGRAHPALERAARTALTGLAAPPSTTLELRLLGPIELWRDGAAVVSVDWRRERVRLLLAYLALHGSVSRTHLADELWPGLRPDAQSRNLRVNLTHLLRVLEPDRAPRAPSFFVRQAAGRLALHPGGRLTVDLWAFDDEAARATDADRRGAAAVGLRHALRAVELWRDEPTDLLSQPWALIDVERCRSRFGSLAVRAGELLLAQGSPDGAQALADRALATDPWSEAAHRLLVAAHRAGGDDVAARRALTRYRVAMDEIGVEPDEATLMVERLVDVSLRSRGP